MNETPMTEERHAEIAKAYREALFPLLSFSVEELEKNSQFVQESMDKFMSFAPVLDPVSYFSKMQSGELHHAEIQAEVARHLLAARKAIQKLGPGGVLGLAQKVINERTEDMLDKE
jgi:hypothetical protein